MNLVLIYVLFARSCLMNACSLLRWYRIISTKAQQAYPFEAAAAGKRGICSCHIIGSENGLTKMLFHDIIV